MNQDDITHHRLRSLGLSEAASGSPESILGRLGAVQSQDYGPAKWSLAQRLKDVGDADLDQLFAEGRILRTHVLRPTWHFVLPEDIAWLLELTAPRVHALNAYYYRQQELDDTVFDKSHTVLADELRGGRHLTRRELGVALDGAGIRADGLRVGLILMNAELKGLICSGALKGKQHTYALLEERAPTAKRLSPDEALAEIVLRYFTSHGPATIKDLKWWSSLRVADIKRGLEMVSSRLDTEVVDEIAYWFQPSEHTRKERSPSVHLLQAYDEYIVGYSESKHLLDISGEARAAGGRRGLFNALIVLDGQVVGRWKRVIVGDTVTLHVAPHRPFDAQEQRALQREADRYGRFLGLTAELVGTDT